MFGPFLARQSPVGQGLLIQEVFLIIHNDATQSVGLLCTSDQFVAETFTWQHTTLTTDRHPRPPVGFRPTISEGEQPQTYALDGAATGTGEMISNIYLFISARYVLITKLLYSNGLLIIMVIMLDIWTWNTVLLITVNTGIWEPLSISC